MGVSERLCWYQGLVRLLPWGPNDNHNNHNDDGTGNYNNGNAVVDGDGDSDNEEQQWSRYRTVPENEKERSGGSESMQEDRHYTPLSVGGILPSFREKNISH